LVKDVPFPIADSTVILEYLHDKTQRVWPDGIVAKTRSRLIEDRADNLCDDAIALHQEKLRVGSSGVSKASDLNALKKRQDRIARILSSFQSEVEAGWLSSEKPGVAEFATVAAVGYLEFRHGSAWRAGVPRLATFFDECQAHDAIRATNPRE